jgi:hypothetical protein
MEKYFSIYLKLSAIFFFFSCVPSFPIDTF